MIFSKTKKNAVAMESRKFKMAFLAGSLILGVSAQNALAHSDLSATAELAPKSGSKVSGTLKLIQLSADKVLVTGMVEGLSPGKHGFHIHVNNNCDSPDAMSAGGHFNPTGNHHGSSRDGEHHLGDLGNIEANDRGQAKVNIEIHGVTVALIGMNSIAERSLIIHANPDDFSDPAGNSGARVACGEIEPDMMRM